MPRTAPFPLLALTAALVAGSWATIAVPAAASTDEDAAVTWSVRPADETGEDGRAWVELEVDPGSVTTEHLAVRNLGSADVTFAVTAADGYLTPTGRFNMLASDQVSVAAGTWIDVTSTVAVPAGETAIVPFTIAVPADATPGDHAAGIAASVSSLGTSDGTTVGVESRVGFRVMVRVAGEVDPALAVAADAAYATAWNPFAPGAVELRYTVENAGNVRLSVAPSTEWDGGVLPSPGSDEAARAELLPGDRRSATLIVPDVWPLGPVTIPLTIEQSVVMPDGTVQDLDPVVRTITVWAVPWPQLLVLAAIALVVFGLLWGRRRRAIEVDRRIAEARELGRREAQSGS